MNSIKFSVYFDNGFWVGLFENFADGNYQVSKIMFGSEPQITEIYNLILIKYTKIKFSKGYNELQEANLDKKINPKRRIREAKKELNQDMKSTKAQMVLQKERENFKEERKIISKKRREEQQELKFAKKEQKKKEKKKGH
jgi:hypothetical protein